MTKLKYPSNGIYKSLSSKLEDSSTYLTNAVNVADFSVPYGLSYRKYLLNLKNVLNGYLKESTSISNQIIKTTNEIENLDNDISDKIKKMDVTTVKDLDRMIY